MTFSQSSHLYPLHLMITVKVEEAGRLELVVEEEAFQK